MFRCCLLVYLFGSLACLAQRQDIGVRGSGGGGSGDVTAAAVFATDNVLIRSDGTGKGVQLSGVSLDDNNNSWGMISFTNGFHWFTNGVVIGWFWNKGTFTNDGAAFFTANLSATKGVFISGSGSDVFQVNNLAFFTNILTIYSNLLVGGSGTFSNGISSVGTNNGAIRLSGTNTGFAEHSVFASGPSNRFVWSVQGAPSANQAISIYSITVDLGTNIIVLTNATVSGGNTFNANQFDSSGTIDLLSGALATNLVHFGTFTFNSAVGLDITATNLSKFGSIDVRTNINANTLTVSNTFTGLGTGNNGIDNLVISNNATIRTNIAAIDIATNELVLNTYYTNSARRAFVGCSVQLTAAAAGTAKVSLRAEYTGTITNVISVSAGPLASLVTIEPLLMLIGPSCRYYLTNETSGTGASVATVNGTSTVSGL